MFTEREGYVLGWIYGRVSYELGRTDDDSYTEIETMRPLSAMARVIHNASAKHKLKPNLQKEIGQAAEEIDVTHLENVAGLERVPPIQVQGAWQLGFVAGSQKLPLKNPDRGTPHYKVAVARRAAGISQAKLANALGVDQSKVSRWESGEARMTEEQEEAIKRAIKELDGGL